MQQLRTTPQVRQHAVLLLCDKVCSARLEQSFLLLLAALHASVANLVKSVCKSSRPRRVLVCQWPEKQTVMLLLDEMLCLVFNGWILRCVNLHHNTLGYMLQLQFASDMCWSQSCMHEAQPSIRRFEDMQSTNIHMHSAAAAAELLELTWCVIVCRSCSDS